MGAGRAAHERLGGFYKGLQFALVGMLVSPEFLLRIERTNSGSKDEPMQLDAWSKATRLSYFLTNSRRRRRR